jgi:hypothetical protein
MQKGRERAKAKQLTQIAWWIAAVLALGVFALSLPGYFKGGIGPLPGTAPVPETILLASRLVSMAASFTTVIVSFCLAVLLFIRKQGDPMALFLSFFLLSYSVVMGGPLEMLPRVIPFSLGSAYQIQTILLTTPTIVLLCIFPSGHFLPRWTRWLWLFTLPLLGTQLLFPETTWTTFQSTSSIILGLLFSAILIASMAAMVYRYRRVSGPVERQQFKWVVVGFILWLVYLALSTVPYTYIQRLPPGAPLPFWAVITGPTWWLALNILPVSLTIAILRFRLFEVDLLIRRTLVYGALTALLALVYFGGVTVVGGVVSAVSVQQSTIAIVISTLAIAALFSPLRRRVQDFIDRRFFRKKYDAAQALEAFALTARNEVDADRVTEILVSVVRETMQPDSISLWLKGAGSEGNP